MRFESSKNLICRTFKISVNQLLPQWSNRTHRKSNWETCSSQYENCDPSIAVSLTGKFSVQNLWAPLSIAVKHICFLNYCDFVQRAYNLVSCQALQGLAGLNTTSETQFYAHKIYIFFFWWGEEDYCFILQISGRIWVVWKCCWSLSHICRTATRQAFYFK